MAKSKPTARQLDLTALRQRLQAELHTLRTASVDTAEDRKPVELDQTSVGRLSRMDAIQSQAMALASERHRRDEVRRIEAALKRIEDGTYGACVSCGEDIAPKRLEADPTVSTCINCASGRSG